MASYTPPRKGTNVHKLVQQRRDSREYIRGADILSGYRPPDVILPSSSSDDYIIEEKLRDGLPLPRPTKPGDESDDYDLPPYSDNFVIGYNNPDLEKQGIKSVLDIRDDEEHYWHDRHANGDRGGDISTKSPTSERRIIRAAASKIIDQITEAADEIDNIDGDEARDEFLRQVSITIDRNYGDVWGNSMTRHGRQSSGYDKARASITNFSDTGLTHYDAIAGRPKFSIDKADTTETTITKEDHSGKYPRDTNVYEYVSKNPKIAEKVAYIATKRMKNMEQDKD